MKTSSPFIWGIIYFSNMNGIPESWKNFILINMHTTVVIASAWKYLPFATLWFIWIISRDLKVLVWLHKKFGPTCEIWDEVRFTFEPASGDSMSLLTKQIVSNEVPPSQKKKKKKKILSLQVHFFAFPHHCFFKVH